jgi:hypothetical protein
MESKGVFQSFVDKWKQDFKAKIKQATNSRKMVFSLTDAIERSEGNRTPLDDVFIEWYLFINSNPLNNNDYFKYLNSYKKGKKLDDNKFRHDLELLHELYKKTDENPDYNPFSLQAYEKYILFMLMKFKEVYTPELDEVFGVKTDENREYNPITNLSRPLRGMFPKSLKLKEFDISRAYPTFIDMEVGITRSEDVYSLIDKRKYNQLLNTHSETKGATIEAVRAELKAVYNGSADKVITEERFYNKGQMFRDLTKYEAEYIYKFIEANNIKTYVRLHDAVIVWAYENIQHTEFGAVKFKSKDVTPPEVINDVKSFYSYNDAGMVETTPVSYKEFFEQENLIRITEQDNDRVTIFKDTNNVVKAFNYKTDTASFLSDNINEFDPSEIENKIAKDNHSTIYGGYLLLNPKPLIYYRDDQKTFGMPFKNGFFYFTKGSSEVQVKKYKEVNGFFAPHPAQDRNFEFTEYSEPCEFERFITMVSTGKDPVNEPMTDDDNVRRDLFFRAIGYLCHTYKDPSFSPAIIFSDEGADDQSRKGGRGKTIMTKALENVRKTLIKGGTEFDGGYRHRFADLEKEHQIYVLDDVPAGFNYDDLYTNIVGDIVCERKGKTAQTIPFKEAPKFIITTNWAVRYDPEATSTHRRFIEFKLTDYFNLNRTPKDVFGHRLFDDWDVNEWNKFYNFIFACVANYIEFGMEAPAYDKNEDNFKAYFHSDAILQEFERIFNIVSKWKNGFNVSDFLSQYNDKENPLRFEKYFHHRNVKTLIDTYIKFKNLDLKYNQMLRKWSRKV